MDDLHTELSSNPPLPGSYTARKGDLCAALFVDNNWYVICKSIESINGKENSSSPRLPLHTLPIQQCTSLFTCKSCCRGHFPPQGSKMVRVCSCYVSSDVIYQGGKLPIVRVIASYCSSDVVALQSLILVLFRLQVQSTCRRRCISQRNSCVLHRLWKRKYLSDGNRRLRCLIN